MAIIRPKAKQGGKAGGKASGKVSVQAKQIVKPMVGGKGAAKGAPGGKGGRAAIGGVSGQWMFVPAGGSIPGPARGGKGSVALAPWAPVGKGAGKHGKHADQDPKVRKNLDKLGKIEADLKVWVGGMKKETKRGALFGHFKEHVKPHMFELMPKGTACVAFKTAEDAQLAISLLNNTELDGKEIQVDVWTQKEKKERPEGEKRERRPKVKKSVLKTSFVKGKAAQPVDSKMKAKLKEVDHSLKAWVGGLSEKTTWKKLKEHFKEMGCEVDLCDLMKKGTAQVTFKTEEEVSGAVAVVNGTELDESTLTVDVWTKPERKEKGEKKAKE